MRKRLAAVALLCLVGAALSGLLLLEYHGENRAVSLVNETCGDGQSSGCEDVARSPYASFAGLPVAAIGLVAFLSLAALALLGTIGPEGSQRPAAATILGLTGLALVLDLVLFILQVVVIKALCQFCIATYAVNVAVFVLVLPARSGIVSETFGLLGGACRAVTVGWILTTLALGGGVAGAEVALRARAGQRQATLLGAPAPLAAPTAPKATPMAPAEGTLPPGAATLATPPPGDAATEAKHWKELAEKLQTTIDDPRKLELYFSEKSMREFDHASSQSLNVSSAPSKGPANAPVQVVTYSDFLCPFCRSLAQALEGFLPQAGGRVVLYFKNYPLDPSCNPAIKNAVHPGSCTLALGGICAQAQGKFWFFHDKVFQSQPQNPQTKDVVKFADEAGLNTGAFEACLADAKTREQLKAEVLEGQRAGIAATPTVFLNGKKLPRINEFVAAVEKEATGKGFPPLEAPRAQAPASKP